VLEAMQASLPEAQWVFTHFSSSAEKLAAAMPVDLHGYLPWDLPGHWSQVIRDLRPSAIVFTKTEIWPNLVRAAAQAGVPTVLTGATLPEVSSRRRWPARAFLRGPLGQLDAVQAIGQPDADGFIALGAREAATSVAGDPGIDSAARRARATDPAASWLAPFHHAPAPTLVAGSTWPEGEAHLRSALRGCLAEVPALRLVVAPHEPTPAHLVPLHEGLTADGWTVATLSDVEAAGSLAGANAILVDRVGVLAGLYTIGSVAYVGGGFGRSGLHSVLEPAAAGLPTVVGPNYRSSAAAIDLIAEGAIRTATDADGLRETLMAWFQDPGLRGAAGATAGRYIDRHSGAAGRASDGILALLAQK